MRTRTRARPFARVRCVCSVLAGFFGFFDPAVVNKFNCTSPGEPTAHSLFAIYFVTVEPEPEIKKYPFIFQDKNSIINPFFSTKLLLFTPAPLTAEDIWF